MTSLEELIAFNDEVVSLTHAGVPIDLGFSPLSRDPDTAKNQINAALTQRVQAGTSLFDTIWTDERLFPPVYQGVVGTGLRCGRLPEALAAQSRYSQSLQDVRQSLRAALVYPLVICGLAYLLFIGSCVFVAPEYDRFLADVDSEGGAIFHVVRMLRDSMPYWVAIPPALLTALMFLGFRSSSSRSIPFRGLPRILSWLPGVSPIIADQRCATLAELLALLVEHEVPLHEGLRLAARASDDLSLASAAEHMANAAEQGKPLTQDSHAAKQFPPFLRWGLTSSTEAGNLAGTLRLAAHTYRRRAERRTQWLRTVTPTVTCIVLAGGVTLLYCLSVFGPLVRLIRDLS